jgi:hypothetical protein
MRVRCASDDLNLGNELMMLEERYCSTLDNTLLLQLCLSDLPKDDSCLIK